MTPEDALLYPGAWFYCHYRNVRLELAEHIGDVLWVTWDFDDGSTKRYLENTSWFRNEMRAGRYQYIEGDFL